MSVPYGYYIAPNGHVAIDQEKANIVRIIYQQYLSDMSLGGGYSCAGVPLFRRNGYRQSSGRKPLFRNRDTALN